MLRGLVRQARSSARWFEEADRHAEQPGVRFAYSLWTRRGPRPWWHYQLHLALQTPAGRTLWRWFTRARRWRRGRRRALAA